MQKNIMKNATLQSMTLSQSVLGIKERLAIFKCQQLFYLHKKNLELKKYFYTINFFYLSGFNPQNIFIYHSSLFNPEKSYFLKQDRKSYNILPATTAFLYSKKKLSSLNTFSNFLDNHQTGAILDLNNIFYPASLFFKNIQGLQTQYLHDNKKHIKKQGSKYYAGNNINFLNYSLAPVNANVLVKDAPIKKYISTHTDYLLHRFAVMNTFLSYERNNDLQQKLSYEEYRKFQPLILQHSLSFKNNFYPLIAGLKYFPLQNNFYSTDGNNYLWHPLSFKNNFYPTFRIRNNKKLLSPIINMQYADNSLFIYNLSKQEKVATPYLFNPLIYKYSISQVEKEMAPGSKKDNNDRVMSQAKKDSNAAHNSEKLSYKHKIPLVESLSSAELAILASQIETMIESNIRRKAEKRGIRSC